MQEKLKVQYQRKLLSTHSGNCSNSLPSEEKYREIFKGQPPKSLWEREVYDMFQTFIINNEVTIDI